MTMPGIVVAPHAGSAGGPPSPPSLPEVPNCEGPLSSIRPLTYVGRVNCVTGQGEAARHQIRILRRHGLKLRIADAGAHGDPDPSRSDEFVQSARAHSQNAHDTHGAIFHLQPNTALAHRANYPRPHVLVSVWETTRLPHAWVPLANEYDQVWCATEWQANVYRESGVDGGKVRVVPFALDPDLFSVEGDTMAEVRRAACVFGSVFQWSERKNPLALVEAYARAFKRGDDVALVLKTYDGDEPGCGVFYPLQDLVRRVGGDGAGIHLVSRNLSRVEMLAFYRSIDCYVSTHRGEGFGFPIAESLLMGKSVVATEWSAPEEYARGLFTGIGYEMESPHGMEWQPFYSGDQRWASVRVGDLAEEMRAFAAGRRRYDRAAVEERFRGLVGRAVSAAKSALEALP